MEIITKNYTQILSEITTYIQHTKISMYWNIGKILAENAVNQITMKQLSTDLQISIPYLYRMLNFYKAYQKAIPSDDLSWSQYSVLSELKDPEFRNLLEEKAKKEGLSSREIKKEVEQNKQEKPVVEFIPPEKLTANRGELYNYKIGKPFPSAKSCLDLGFLVFKDFDFKAEIQEKEIVKITKINEEYSIVKTEIKSRSIHTYKGYLTRIVDGDTIRVSIDLGFGVFREEILRLKDVYASELKTEEGQKHKKILEKILENVKFVILRTYKTDMYGRYVCDVFYSQKEMDDQKVADQGRFLNQELADIFLNKK